MKVRDVYLPPFVPSRTEPAPFAGRIVLGALAGILVARLAGSDTLAAGLTGGVSAAGRHTSSHAFGASPKRLVCPTGYPGCLKTRPYSLAAPFWSLSSRAALQVGSMPYTGPNLPASPLVQFNSCACSSSHRTNPDGCERLNKSGGLLPIDIVSTKMESFKPAWRCFLACMLLLPTTLSSRAQSEDPSDPSPHSSAELVSEITSIQPGRPFTVALRLEMDDHWHSYWKNPGDSGQRTTIDWRLPEGFDAGDIQWPHPQRIDSGPLTSYGYSDEVLLLTEITPPDTLEAGTSVTLEGTADWLICEEICLLASGELQLILPVASSDPAPSDWRDEIAEARSKLPVEPEGWDIRATRSGGTYALRIAPDQATSLEDSYFFPSEKATIQHAAPQPLSRDGSAYLIALQRSEYAQAPADTLTGVLVAPDFSLNGERVRAVAINVPVEEAQTAGLTAGGAEDSLSIWWALLFAFIGGMILNLMPCVFPILSIKILGFARHSDQPERDIRKHGLVFGAGVIVSFWVLAGILLLLRAGGSEVGWGFQLQSPTIIALMALLFFGIGLSLLGVFEVGGSLMQWGGRLERRTDSSRLGGSFLSGVLATVVATPCTAPFMGAALGLALTLTAAGAFLIFTTLGIGMALPYVGLSMAPPLLQRLPKPGPWMETLKQVLAFPMFATTVWLVWVFGQQVGNSGVALLLLSLLLLAAGAWLIGRWKPSNLSRRMRIVTRGAAVLILAGALGVGLMGAGYETSTRTSSAPGTDADWWAFSSEAVDELRSEGRPLFIDFTAAWCLTCQVNKRTTLSSPSVTRAFREKRVVLMRADWTNEDPEITRALESHGRSGVPLYVLYRGDGSEPILLPEILTQDLVLDALDDIPSPAARSSQTDNLQSS